MSKFLIDDREAIAAVQHEIWAHWMEYFFGKCQYAIGNNGTVLTFPVEDAERWQRQMGTPYSELPEQERGSDRDQADKVIAVLQAAQPSRLFDQLRANEQQIAQQEERIAELWAELLTWRRQAAEAEMAEAGVEARPTP